jgi:hypothetical protein
VYGELKMFCLSGEARAENTTSYPIRHLNQPTA